VYGTSLYLNKPTFYFCRDYTNPYLPVAPSAIDGSGQFSIGPDGKRREPESNVLLVSIENMQYAVTLDVLHTVSSRCCSCFHC
jgi:hypothetical protein